MQKWADKRAEIEQEAKEIQEAIRTDEDTQVFDDMMGNPMEQLEELCRAFD
jgi:hypothetical protein